MICKQTKKTSHNEIISHHENHRVQNLSILKYKKDNNRIMSKWCKKSKVQVGPFVD